MSRPTPLERQHSRTLTAKPQREDPLLDLHVGSSLRPPPWRTRIRPLLGGVVTELRGVPVTNLRVGPSRAGAIEPLSLIEPEQSPSRDVSDPF